MLIWRVYRSSLGGYISKLWPRILDICGHIGNVQVLVNGIVKNKRVMDDDNPSPAALLYAVRFPTTTSSALLHTVGYACSTINTSTFSAFCKMNSRSYHTVMDRFIDTIQSSREDK